MKKCEKVRKIMKNYGTILPFSCCPLVFPWYISHSWIVWSLRCLQHRHLSFLTSPILPVALCCHFSFRQYGLLYKTTRVVTDNSLDSSEKQNHDKKRKNCPKNVQKLSENCPKIVPSRCRDKLLTFLPIWSMFLSGNPVQCTPVTEQEMYQEWQWSCEAASPLEAPKPRKNQSRRKVGQK